MFNVYLHDGTKPLPEDDICYIIAKDGIYLKKKLGVMDSIAPVKEISILQDIKPTAKMNIPKIPAVEFARIYEFFKAVYNAHHSEAIVLLFFNEETRKYKVIAPHQKVSAAGAEYDRGIVIEGYTMIGTIHSHANFSAFHSSTDVGDEMNFDGLHITIGHVLSETPSITACVVANAHRVVVQPEEYVSGIVKPSAVQPAQTAEKPASQKAADPPVKQVYKIVNGALVRDIPGYQNRFPGYVYQPHFSSWDKPEIRYVIKVPESKRKFNPKWLELVEKGTTRYNWQGGKYRQAAWPYYAGYDEWWDATGEIGEWEKDGWGRSYNPSYWQQRNLPAVVPGQPPQKAEGPIVIENGEAPCANCKYRDYKLQEEDLEVWYKCTKCNTVILDDFEEDKVVCPKCKSADNLEEVEDFGLVDKYTPVSKRLLDKNGDLKLNHIEGKLEKESTFYKCEKCGTTFNKFDSQVECPFCYTEIPKEYSKEEEIHTQASSDSGDYLDKDFEEIAKQTERMDAEGPTKIPDPTINSIPIQERHVPVSRPISLREMFRKVFGGKHV